MIISYYITLQDEGPKIGAVSQPAELYRRLRAAQLVIYKYIL